MINKEALISFFSQKSVRLVIFFIIIATVMTGVAFGIMALLKAINPPPTCPTGQSVPPGQSSCFENACSSDTLSKDCPLSGAKIDFSNAPKCPCTNECPDGQSEYPPSRTAQNKKCINKCGESEKTDDNQICVYYDPQSIKNEDKDLKFVSSDYKKNECKDSKGNIILEKGFPVICNNKGFQCATENGITYCKNKNAGKTGECTDNNITGCIKGENCKNGSNCINDSTITNTSIGYCEISDLSENCCKKDKLTISNVSKGKKQINCCSESEEPIDIDKPGNNIFPSGCCPTNKLIRKGPNKGRCCNTTITNDGETCCENTKVFTTEDGKLLCCPYEVITQNGKQVCTKESFYPISGSTGNCKIDSDCDKFLDSTQRDDSNIKAYCDPKDKMCHYECGFYDDKSNTLDSYILIDSVSSTKKISDDKIAKTLKQSYCYKPGNMCELSEPIFEGDNTNQVICSDSSNNEFWSPVGANSTQGTKENAMSYSTKASAVAKDSNKNFCNPVSCAKAFENFGFNDFKTVNIGSDFTCKAETSCDNIDIMQTKNGSTISWPWYKGTYLSLTSDNAVAPIWNKDGTFTKNSQSNMLECITNDCKYLSNGEFCEYGSFNGTDCISKEDKDNIDKTKNLCYYNNNNQYESNIMCKQPLNGSPKEYYCYDDVNKIGLNNCCGKGYIDTINEPPTCKCLGAYTKDTQNKCTIINSIQLLELSRNFFDQPNSTLNAGFGLKILGTNPTDWTPSPSNPPPFPYIPKIVKPHNSLIILSTTISGTSKFLNLYNKYLTLTDGSQNLGFYYVISDKKGWNNSIAANTAAGLAFLNNNNPYRILNGYGNKPDNSYGVAVTDQDTQNSGGSVNIKSIFPIPINNYIVLGATHVSYSLLNSTADIITEQRLGFLNIAVWKDSKIEFIQIKNSIGDTNNLEESQLPTNYIKFNVEVQDYLEERTNSNIKFTDIINNLSINKILSNYQMYGTPNAPATPAIDLAAS